MKRLVLVYNPRSSKQAAIEQEVLAEVRNLPGWMVGKYAVSEHDLDYNAAKLAKVINEGDLVIAAGGDGTASMAANGVILSGKQATLGVLSYGNFNDMAQMLGTTREEGVRGIIEKFETGKLKTLYPLEVVINRQHWRYAMCYVTIGLLAEATEMMDDAKMRKNLNTGKHGPLYSLFKAVGWYFKNKRKKFLPAGVTINGQAAPKRMTDYMAINGSAVARLMKGGDWYGQKKRFGSGVFTLGGFWRMVRFGLKSITGGVPVAETERDELVFADPSEIEIQAEGEYQRLKDVSQMEVRKGVGIVVVWGK